MALLKPASIASLAYSCSLVSSPLIGTRGEARGTRHPPGSCLTHTQTEARHPACGSLHTSVARHPSLTAILPCLENKVWWMASWTGNNSVFTVRKWITFVLVLIYGSQPVNRQRKRNALLLTFVHQNKLCRGFIRIVGRPKITLKMFPSLFYYFLMRNESTK